MYKLIAQIEADADKRAIYELKETLMRIGSQHSCKIEMTISSSEGFQEMTSASFSPVIEVKADDIVDLTLTGDEQYELLELQEKVGDADEGCH
jgi:glycine cleavage system regulatory protein